MTNLWSPLFLSLLSPLASAPQPLLASPAPLWFLTGLGWETNLIGWEAKLISPTDGFLFWPQALALTEGEFCVFKE